MTTMDPLSPSAPPRAATGRPGPRRSPAKRPLQPVTLLGCGPGDADLLTVRAAAVLAEADAVLVAPGVSFETLAGVHGTVLTAPGDVPDAAKEAAARAKAGQRVVRVYPGDPFLH